MTKADILKLLEQTIKQIKHAKLGPLERSRELRALLAERSKLLEIEPPEKWKDKVTEWQEKAS